MKKIEDWKLALYFMLVFYGVMSLLLLSQMGKLHLQWAVMKQEFDTIKYHVYTPAIAVIRPEEWK
jgi:hypothetical protein